MPEHIPHPLPDLTRWLVWGYRWNYDKKRKDGSGQKGDWNKPPLSARSLCVVDGTDPAQWVSFDEVLVVYRAHRDGPGRLDGIGLAMADEDIEDALVAVDLDRVLDEHGEIEPWACEIVERLNTYTEWSPSGTGLHLFCRARLSLSDGRHGRKRGSVEVYRKGHYLTVTGHRLDGTPATVEPRSEAIAWLLATHIDRPRAHLRGQPAPPAPAPASAPPAAEDLSDEELLRRAFRSKNGAELRALLDGSADGYPSDSEADLATCSRLRFWCAGDAARIERIVSASARGQRGKWRDREDYRQRTIATALAGGGEVYDTSRARRKGRARPSSDGTPGASPEGEENGPDATEDDIPVRSAVDDPHRLAGGFLELADGVAGCPTPRRWRDEWYCWRGGHYAAVKDSDVQSRLVRHIKAEFDRHYRLTVRQAERAARENDEDPALARRQVPPVQKVTRPLTANALQALASLTNLDGEVEAPAWIVGDGPWPADEVLVAPNALVHLPSLAPGNQDSKKVAVLSPTPRLFATGVLGCPFDAQAPPPGQWLSFLGQLWPDDRQAVEALQEWFGYCLTPDTSQHKILLILGPRRSGKSTIVRVLRALLGAQNTCAPTLSGLGLPFGLQPLLGKTLATIADARLSGRTDLAIVTERLLSISGEDAQTVDRKHLPSLTLRLAVRFMILSNELPALRDSSGALVGRMVILRLAASWYGREDRSLCGRLLKELPGILGWAIEGWRRLQRRGHFVQPDSALALIDQMEDLSSPVGAFVRERCEVARGLSVETTTLYHAWTEWATSRGHPVSTEQVFGRDLRAAVGGLDTSRPRVGTERIRRYLGIRLRLAPPDPHESG
jgi:putative DNA primase/helicase